MRALVCTKFGPPESLELRDLPSPVPGPNQVVVTVRACGVNFPDALIIQGLYQYQPAMPFAPGSEVAGVVKAVGPGVMGAAPGDRVIVVTTWGGFSEEVVADRAGLIPIPPALDDVTASATVLAYGTSHYALAHRARLAPGETLLVLGAAGGVGLAAVEIGKALGARVIAAASSAEKLAVCRERGADELIDYGRDDLRDRIKALTGGAGVDVIYDPVGGALAEPAVRSMAWRGRYLVVGFASGEIPRIPLNLTLLKGCAIVGVFWGEFTRREPALHRESVAQVMRWIGDGVVRPLISGTYPLAQGGQAIRAMMDRKVIGKLVVVP